MAPYCIIDIDGTQWRHVGFSVLPFLIAYLVGYAAYWFAGLGDYWVSAWPLLSLGAHYILVAGGASLLVSLLPSRSARWSTLIIYWLGYAAVVQNIIGGFVGRSHWRGLPNGDLILDFYANAGFYLGLSLGVPPLLGLLISGLGCVAVAACLWWPADMLYRSLSGVRGRVAVGWCVGVLLVFATALIIFSGLHADTRTRLLYGYQKRDPVGGIYVVSAQRWMYRELVSARSIAHLKLARARLERDDSLSRPRDTPNVILIVVDALRADFTPGVGQTPGFTPTLDSLLMATHHTVVERGYAAGNNSEKGIIAVHQSRLQSASRGKHLALQDVLKAAGYRTAFFLSGNHAAFGNLDLVHGGNVDYLVHGPGFSGYVPTDDRGALVALDAYVRDAPPAPSFFSIHLMSVHAAGVHFGSRVPARPARLRAALAGDSLTNRKLAYALRVEQLDGVLSAALGTLRVGGYLDDAIIVLTADHGESLGELGFVGATGHGTAYTAEQFRVPLLVFDTRATSSDTVAFGSQLDIAPTVIDLLGLPAFASFRGRSLLDDERPRYAPLDSRDDPDYYRLLAYDTSDVSGYRLPKPYSRELANAVVGIRAPLLPRSPIDSPAREIPPAVLQRYFSPD